MVTPYTPNTCEYLQSKLKKEVYLLPQAQVKSIHVDGGRAYVELHSFYYQPLSLSVREIQVTDSSSLDERYEFRHRVNFSVNGKFDNFDVNYAYVVVQTINNEYYLVNPKIPCKISYTYTLDGSDSRTDFQFETSSNYPMMPLDGVSFSAPKDCGYRNVYLKALELNSRAYTNLTKDNVVQFTNDGFKVVGFNPKSCSYVETFDGNIHEAAIEFDIRLSRYKDTWHYNLLEFTDNLYSALIGLSDGSAMTAGFNHGLRPNFEVSANTDSISDKIHIILREAYDSGYNPQIITDTEYLGNTQWRWSDMGNKCVGANTALRLLKEEIDMLGNKTDRYQVLEGYEDEFPTLEIVDTFDDEVYVVDSHCSYKDDPSWCDIETSLPQHIDFTSKGSKTFTVYSYKSPWSAHSDNNIITVSPSSGTSRCYI